MIGFLLVFLTISGLSVFEIISSIDNAIINAEVLSTMGKKTRQWFLLWGLLFAVFVIRGILPWIIVWLAAPIPGFFGSLTATFSNDSQAATAIHTAAPILFIGAGTFLIFLFLHWLFLEPKNYGFIGERFLYSQSVWFYAVASVFLAIVVWFAMRQNPLMGFSAVVGSTAFFITHGFRQNAAVKEKQLSDIGKTDISKILYLEIIDATFSIDGVLGAFAFTLSVPLIFLGNGLGALVLRQLTVRNIENIKKYQYLKNGAMYSILFLGCVMLLKSFGFAIPEWISPILTFIAIGYFFFKSKKT